MNDVRGNRREFVVAKAELRPPIDLPRVFIEEMLELIRVQISRVALVADNARRIDEDAVGNAGDLQTALHTLLGVAGNRVIDVRRGHFANVRLGLITDSNHNQAIVELFRKNIELRN